MNKKFLILFFVLLSLQYGSFSQVGGIGTYGFLNLPVSPRNAALGGKLVALDEPDFSVVLTNPSHLSEHLHNQLFLSYVLYYADIQYAFAAFTHHLKGFGTVGLGLQHVGYKDFIEADVSGEITGSFSGQEMAFHLFYSYSIDSLFAVGVNLKPIYSHLERYTSYGIAADLGASYRSRDGLTEIGVAAKNMGTMLKPYNPNTWEKLPFELVLGFSKKLQHAPFRIIGVLQQAQTTDLYYNRASANRSAFDDSSPKISVFDRVGNELITHLVFGVEFIPVKNFYVRGGYNFQRRHEMKIQERVSMVGFSWGIGVRVNRFDINYGRATYHLVGGTNHFSVSTSLDNLFTKKFF